MTTPDKRMFELMAWAVKNGKAVNETEYWEKIGFLKTNVYNVKIGKQSFRIEHIRKACLLTGANANWILGIEESMFREVKKTTPIQQIKQALQELEKGYTKGSQKIKSQTKTKI